MARSDSLKKLSGSRIRSYQSHDQSLPDTKKPVIHEYFPGRNGSTKKSDYREDSENRGDAQIIIGCKNNDPDYQEKLYKKYYGYILAIAMQYCPIREDALEVVNDSFIKVFNNIGSFDPSKTFKPWLRRIVINTAIDRLRKDAKYQTNTSFNEFYSLSKSDSETDSEFTVKQIHRMISHLPVSFRMVFNLYEIEGYSHAEIADQLQISESSSRTYLTRAKAELRKMYNTYFSDRKP